MHRFRPGIAGSRAARRTACSTSARLRSATRNSSPWCIGDADDRAGIALAQMLMQLPLVAHAGALRHARDRRRRGDGHHAEPAGWPPPSNSAAAFRAKSSPRLKVDSPEIVCQLLAQDLRALTRESLRALLLDTKYQLLRIEEISLGSLNESIAHPREIFRPGADAFGLRDHPGSQSSFGRPDPEQADKRLPSAWSRSATCSRSRARPHHHRRQFGRGQPSYYSFKEAGADVSNDSSDRRD